MGAGVDGCRWWIGIAAAMLIVFSLPVYYFSEVKNKGGVVIPDPEQTFVGSINCRGCHNREYDKWEGSHHDLAMDVANETTVLGDFNNAEFTLHGITSRYLMDADFQFALADFYLGQGLFEKARPIVEDMVLIHPENPVGIQMLDYIQRNAGEK